MNRRPLFIANWKMALSHKSALENVKAVKKLSKDIPGDVDVVICPSFPSLPAISEAVAKKEHMFAGAQTVHWEEHGAWTGEVSAVQLQPFVDYCIVGHSERRALAGETDEQVAHKAAVLIKHSITPIVCIGESWDERQAGQTVERITAQVETLFSIVSRVDLSKLVVAYEPIWAISSNNPVEPPDPMETAQNMLLIRKRAASHFGADVSERLRVVYGGSVNAENVTGYVSEPGVDGALVGSASLKPVQFVAIATAIAQAERE